MTLPGATEYILNELQVHRQLQETILRDIARRLVKNPSMVTDTAAWEAEKLQQSGLLFDDIIKELSEITERQTEEIKQAFKGAETTIFDYDEEVIAKVGFDPEEFKKLSPSMQQTWAASLAKTSTEAINLTKTTALTSQASYIEACDLALMQVQSGAFDYNTAIRNACLQAGAKGVNVVYPSGWVDKLDVAVRRSVLTGVSQTAGQLQEIRAEEMECDIMELSAHSGARPRHVEWQGKLVSRSGKPGYLSLDDIGYGTVTGFKGANCRHNWFMFFEGISKRKYTDEQLEEMKNETVTYNGQEMPLWKAKDYRSRLERAVKASKRELVVLDEAMKNTTTDELKNELKMSFSERSVRLKKQEARLKDFCKQTDLYYDSSRLQVFTQATENGIKNWGKSVSSKAVWAKRNIVVNEARSDEVFTIWPPMKGDAIKPQSIYKELQKSNVGKEAWEYILKANLDVEFTYTDEGPPNTLGECWGNHIVVYARATKTIKQTAKTLIHEVTHTKLKIGGDQWAEAVCIAQEVRHDKDVLTYADKRDIIKKVKRLYPDYQWRKKK